MEGVPVIEVYSEKDLIREIEKAGSMLATDKDWSARLAALQRLQGIVAGGAKRYPAFPTLLRQLVAPFKVQLSDRRSSIVKQVLCKLVVITVQVIAESADTCIRTLLMNCRVARSVPHLLDLAVHDKSPLLRTRCAEYGVLALKVWGSFPDVQRHVALFESFVKSGVCDAESEVRMTARHGFRVFFQLWPERAHRLLQSLDASTQKYIREEGDLVWVNFLDGVNGANGRHLAAAGPPGAAHQPQALSSPHGPKEPARHGAAAKGGTTGQNGVSQQKSAGAGAGVGAAMRVQASTAAPELQQPSLKSLPSPSSSAHHNSSRRTLNFSAGLAPANGVPPDGTHASASAARPFESRIARLSTASQAASSPSAGTAWEGGGVKRSTGALKNIEGNVRPPPPIGAASDAAAGPEPRHADRASYGADVSVNGAPPGRGFGAKRVLKLSGSPLHQAAQEAPAGTHPTAASRAGTASDPGVGERPSAVAGSRASPRGGQVAGSGGSLTLGSKFGGALGGAKRVLRSEYYPQGVVLEEAGDAGSAQVSEAQKGHRSGDHEQGEDVTARAAPAVKDLLRHGSLSSHRSPPAVLGGVARRQETLEREHDSPLSSSGGSPGSHGGAGGGGRSTGRRSEAAGGLMSAVATVLGAGRSDWLVRVETLNRLQVALQQQDTRAIQQIVQNLDKVVALITLCVEDAHHKVSQAALAALQHLLSACSKEVEGSLGRLLPHLFARLIDAKEASRQLAAAVLATAQQVYTSEALVPVWLRSLEEQRNVKCKVAVIESASGLFAARGAGANAPPSDAAHGPGAGAVTHHGVGPAKQWLLKLVALTSDPQGKVKDAATRGIASLVTAVSDSSAAGTGVDVEALAGIAAALPETQRSMVERALRLHSPAGAPAFVAAMATHSKAAKGKRRKSMMPGPHATPRPSLVAPPTPVAAAIITTSTTGVAAPEAGATAQLGTADAAGGAALAGGAGGEVGDMATSGEAETPSGGPPAAGAAGTTGNAPGRGLAPGSLAEPGSVPVVAPGAGASAGSEREPSTGGASTHHLEEPSGLAAATAAAAGAGAGAAAFGADSDAGGAPEREGGVDSAAAATPAAAAADSERNPLSGSAPAAVHDTGDASDVADVGNSENQPLADPTSEDVAAPPGEASEDADPVQDGHGQLAEALDPLEKATSGADELDGAAPSTANQEAPLLAVIGVVDEGHLAPSADGQVAAADDMRAAGERSLVDVETAASGEPSSSECAAGVSKEEEEQLPSVTYAGLAARSRQAQRALDAEVADRHNVGIGGNAGIRGAEAGGAQCDKEEVKGSWRVLRNGSNESLTAPLPLQSPTPAPAAAGPPPEVAAEESASSSNGSTEPGLLPAGRSAQAPLGEPAESSQAGEGRVTGEAKEAMRASRDEEQRDASAAAQARGADGAGSGSDGRSSTWHEEETPAAAAVAAASPDEGPQLSPQPQPQPRGREHGRAWEEGDQEEHAGGGGGGGDRAGVPSGVSHGQGDGSEPANGTTTNGQLPNGKVAAGGVAREAQLTEHLWADRRVPVKESSARQMAALVEQIVEGSSDEVAQHESAISLLQLLISSQVLVTVSACIDMLLKETDPPLTYEMLVELIAEGDEESLPTLLTCLAKVVPQLPVELLRERVTAVLPSLFATFGCNHFRIRQAVALCLVKIRAALGDDLKPYLEALSQKQHQLMALYAQHVM
eukprot:jgi/Mesen1/10016/ME000723S09373